MPRSSRRVFSCVVGLGLLTAIAPGALAQPGGAAVLVREHTDSEQCALRPHLMRALTRLIPGIAVRDHGEPSGDDLVVIVTVKPGSVAVALDNAQGRRLLSRQLDRTPADRCDELGHAAAFIIDRFLSVLAWPGLPPAVSLRRQARDADAPSLTARLAPGIPGLSSTPALPLLLMPPAAVERPAVAIERRAAPVSRYVTGALGVATTSDPSPGVVAILGVRQSAVWRLELVSAIHLGRDHPVALIGDPDRALGTARSRRVELAVSLGRCFRTYRFACIAAEAGLQITRIQATGDALFQLQSASAIHPTVGARGSIGRRLTRRLSVELIVTARSAMGRTRFAVEGVGILDETPRLSASVTLAARRRFF